MKNRGLWAGSHRWAWLCLVLPVLVACWRLHGLEAQLVTFHGTDETLFHLPAIQQMAAQWPHPDLTRYSSATTPLFHLLFAAMEHHLGERLAWMRAVNVGMSLVAVVLLVVLMRRHVGLDRASAMWCGVAFGLSPYFFGAAFVLLTDNMGWMLALAALVSASHAVNSARTPGQGAVWWGVACTLLVLALLTRQTHVWLLPCMAVLAWRQPSWSVAAKCGAWLTMALAVIPMVGLFMVWHGTVPPGFQQQHQAGQLLNGRALQYMLAVTGLYWALMVAPVMGLRGLSWRQVAAAVALGLAVMAWQPLATRYGDDGFLWKVARNLPHVQGGAVIFWGLIPLGAVAVLQMCRLGPWQLGTVGWLAYAGVMARSELLYQKYFDPMVPVLLWCALPWAQVPESRLRWGVVAWVALGGLYTIQTLAHQ